MWDNNLKLDMIADEVNEIIAQQEEGIKKVASILKAEFPSLNLVDAERFALLLNLIREKNKGTYLELVATTPVSFKTKSRKTYPVLYELISSAQESITLTGYSISEHFDDLFNLIYLKSKQGVKIELFLNNYNELKHLFKNMKKSKNNFFKIYSYSGINGDEMASLHAKTLIVDKERSFISSANLSYHGMIGNIEIGVLIISKQIANQILDIFSELKRTKKFILVMDT